MNESGVGKQEGQEEFQTQLVGWVLLGGKPKSVNPMDGGRPQREVLYEKQPFFVASGRGRYRALAGPISLGLKTARRQTASCLCSKVSRDAAVQRSQPPSKSRRAPGV